MNSTIALIVLFLVGIAIAYVTWLMFFSEKETAREETHQRSSISNSDVSNLVGVLVAGWATYKLVNMGMTFLKNVDWESVNENLKRAIDYAGADLERLKDNNARLERVSNLLKTENKISIDQAAMLLSATLELGIKSLCQRHNVQYESSEVEGMVGIAIKLRALSIISDNDFNEIKTWVRRVRNPVMHGDFENFDSPDVKEMQQFALKFFAANQLI